MNILFITNNYTPYSGGVVSSINATIHALQKKGHEVRIVTFQFLCDHTDPAYVYRVPTLVKFVYKKNRMIFGWQANKFLQKIFKNFTPDIVHVHHPFLLGPRVIALARKCHIPTMFTYHTMYEKYTHYVPLPKKIVTHVLSWKLEKFITSVDGVIAPSSEIRTRVIAIDTHKPVWIIPSGLQERFIALKFCKTAYSVSDPFKLIVVSRFSKEKNVQVALDILAQLPEYVRLTLVGYGDQEAHLRAYAYDKLRLSSNRVQFIIDPSKDMLPKLYQDAHLFIFTSQTDTQGLVLAESMAASTPVLAFPGAGQADIILNGENGYIVHSVSAMVAQIMRIMHDTELYNQLQVGAFKTSRTYHADVLCGKLLAAYNFLITASKV